MRSILVLLVLGLSAVCSAPLRAQLQPSPLQWERLSGSRLPAGGTGGSGHAAEVGPYGSLPSTAAAARLGPGSGAIVGGVIGAAMGYTVLYFHCGDRFCEMWPVVEVLGGAVVGSSIGRVLAERAPDPGRLAGPSWRH
jgi:hypothetical protein